MAGSVPPLTALRQEDGVAIDARFPKPGMMVHYMKTLAAMMVRQPEYKVLRLTYLYYRGESDDGVAGWYDWPETQDPFELSKATVKNPNFPKEWGLSPESFEKVLEQSRADTTSKIKAAVVFTLESGDSIHTALQQLNQAQTITLLSAITKTMKNKVSMLVLCDFKEAFDDRGFLRQLVRDNESSNGFSRHRVPSGDPAADFTLLLASTIMMVFLKDA